VAQGCAAIFDCLKRLKMQETENRFFCFRVLINAMDGINQSFPNLENHRPGPYYIAHRAPWYYGVEGIAGDQGQCLLA
jgi:hypothetical protein